MQEKKVIKTTNYISSIWLLIFAISTSNALYSSAFQQTFHKTLGEKTHNGPYKHTLEINIKNEHAGFFSYLKGIVGCLEYYEQHAPLFTDITINLQGGPYAYPDKETNWWLSYFEPIVTVNDIPRTTQNKQISLSSVFIQKHFALMSVEACKKEFSRERAFYLIAKYLKIKPFIQEQIDEFATNRMKNDFIIGIHYRGTDKACEAPSINYQMVYDSINGIVNSLENKPYKIFVATDEQAFLDDISTKYQQVLSFNQHRSTTGQPVHVGPQPVTLLQRGVEALIDCVLLSKCNVLIVKTQSNLSSSASDFNPNMPVIMLNNPYPEFR